MTDVIGEMGWHPWLAVLHHASCVAQTLPLLGYLTNAVPPGPR
jgi:hypothetical protein